MYYNHYSTGAKEINLAATVEHLRDQRPLMVKRKVYLCNQRLASLFIFINYNCVICLSFTFNNSFMEVCVMVLLFSATYL